jgi:hypothetical protein
MADQESVSDFNDMVTNFRRGMIPVVGAACLGFLLIFVLFLHWKGQVCHPPFQPAFVLFVLRLRFLVSDLNPFMSR